MREEEIRMHEYAVFAEDKEQAELLWEDDPYGDDGTRIKKQDEYHIATSYDIEEVYFDGDDE